ncbi:MAG: restriction endonuclease [Anaerolineaceae bacterium]|nr:restriction endonuclease [Anaerolineaceae bacterium]
MQFKDAAYEVLKKAGQPLHYREIAARAMEAGLLETLGRTPEATMGAMLYTDTINPDSRFRRGDTRGTFALKVFASGTIQQQIDSIQEKICKDLRKQLLQMPPQKFEELIRLLLEQMGFEETEITPYSNDKGVDVRGVLRSNPLSVVKVSIQAKRWTNNVGSGVVRDLRGSLKVADSEQGLIITPSDFSISAKEEAQATGKTPIRLINGNQLVDLLIQYNVGVKKEEYVVPTIDSEYWAEVLGVALVEPESTVKSSKKEKAPFQYKITYPVNIQASYKDQIYQAQLITPKGIVQWNDQTFETPSSAAKAVAIDWKAVNGWNFWQYQDPETGKLEKIGRLRKYS